MLPYSLAGATEELGPMGLRVHRSNWVAFAAVRRVYRRGRGLRLLLEGGHEVEVSRRRQSEVLAHFGDGFHAREAGPSATEA